VLDGATAIADGSRIPDDYFDSVVAKAKNGDADAALRLSLHYPSHSPDRWFWQRAAAELGAPAAQYNEWVRLSDLGDCASKREGLAWLEKAYAGGITGALVELERYRSEVAGCK